MNTYTVYRLRINGALTNKEHLNNVDELNTWIASVFGRFANIMIVSDRTGKTITMTDNGEWFEIVGGAQ